MNNKLNIAIIGAGGYLGTEITSALVKNHKVHVIARKQVSIEGIQSQLILKEYSESLVKKYLSFMSVDVVLNLAWAGSSGDARNDKELQDSNVQMVKDYYEIAHGLDLPYICVGSTAEILAKEPVTIYGQAKASLNQFFSVRPSAHWWTFSNIFGGNDQTGRFIISMLDKMIKNEDIKINTTGEQLIPSIYIDDFTAMVVNKFDNEDYSDEVFYNINVTVKELLQEMHKVVGSTSKLEFGDVKVDEAYVELFETKNDDLLKVSIERLINDYKRYNMFN